jgi:hypothetical protein
VVHFHEIQQACDDIEGDLDAIICNPKASATSEVDAIPASVSHAQQQVE